MKNDSRANRRWFALASLGVNFAATVGAFCLLGYWIDRHWQIRNHRGLIVCAILGLIGGFYNMIRQALHATRENAGRQKHTFPRRDGDHQ